jgi:CHAD domain-containing protein
MALDQTRLVKPVKKLRKLLNKLKRDSTPKNVHELRTSVRRFEATFRALDLDGAGAPKSLVKDLDVLRKRAGKIRDMDILTEFAASHRLKGEEECHVRLLEHLGSRRQKQARKLHNDLKQHGASLRKQLEQTSSRIIKLLDGKNARAAENATSHAAATAVRLSTQLALPPRLNKTNLHPYRLKVKELRNIVQMAQAPSPHELLKALGEVKDAIGEWHDYAELVKVASKHLTHGSQCALLSDLRRTAERKYAHALSLTRNLRRTYLQRSNRKKSASAGVPRPPVWEAMARLAG